MHNHTKKHLRALALALAATTMLSACGGDDEPTAGPGGGTESETRSPGRGSGASETTEAESEAPAPEPEPSPEETEEEQPTGDPTAFAQTYYGYLPDDPGSAYQLLSPDYRAQTSQADYEAFWSTVESVQVGGLEVVDDTTVDVSLTYVTANGTEPETRRLYLATSADGYVIVASKGGAPDNPDWYHNLQANPDATIEVGDDTLDVRAEELPRAERDEKYAEQARLYPGFAEYERKTDRVIPVVALTPTA